MPLVLRCIWLGLPKPSVICSNRTAFIWSIIVQIINELINCLQLDGDINDIRLIALVACACIVVIILVGLSFESKMQIVLMVVLWLSIFDYWIGTFLPASDDQSRRGTTGYRSECLALPPLSVSTFCSGNNQRESDAPVPGWLRLLHGVRRLFPCRNWNHGGR